MTALRALIDEGRAGLTVYSPDAARSGLWGNLDDKIQKATGFGIARRQIFEHDVNSVKRFYQELGAPIPDEEDPEEAVHRYANMNACDIKYGHLVVRLLISGPSLVTIWQGEDAVKKLLALKGRTQPADSDPKSIRGGFWCDNGVCSLIHSSDDKDEVRRELSALNLEGWLDAQVEEIAPMQSNARACEGVAHSGIFALHQVLNRQLDRPVELELPRFGDAKQTRSMLVGELRKARFQKYATLVESFFSGDMVALTQGLKTLVLTSWEHFVIQCSTVNQETWND